MSVRTCLTALTTTAVVMLGIPVAAMAAPDAGPPAPAAPSADFAPGRVLVKYQPGVPLADQAQLERGNGAARISAIEQIGVKVLQVPAGTEDRVVAALARDGRVTLAERDGTTEAAATPDDSLWSKQWGPAKVELPAAWDVSRGSASSVVAVLDTGVDQAHPDLAGRVLAGYDFVNNDADAADDHGHGTKSAGVAGAVTDNGQGVAGGCWTCSILPVKVLSSTGSGTMSALASGITFSADRGATVISMSLSGTSASSAVQDAARYAAAKGALLLGSAGNQGTDEPRYPAAFPEVVSVAGSQSDDSLYSWSSYGSTVDVAAPGCNQTTLLGGGYGSFCGTSSATPLVAGAAAVAFATGSPTADAVRAALSETAVPIGPAVVYGRISAAATVLALSSTNTTAPAPAPVEEPAQEEPTAEEPTETITTWTFSGSLNGKARSRSWTVDVPAGSLATTLTYTRASSMTVTVRSASGAVVASASGGSPVTTSSTVAASSYSVEVSGDKGSFTLDVTSTSG